MFGEAPIRSTARSLPCRLVLGCLLSVAMCASAGALDPGKRLTQYGHTAWRTQDASFSGVPQAAAQTSDGYLWIGTTLGLVRFDGVRFVAWNPPAGQHLLDPRIFSLLAAHDGSLWIGTGYSVSHWANGQLANYPQISGRIEALVEDAKGAVWLARTQIADDMGPICRIDGSGVKCYGEHDGLPGFFPVILARSDTGDLWVGGYWADGYSELSRWRPGSPPIDVRRGDKHLQGVSSLKAVAAGRAGSLWVAIDDPGLPLRLDHLQDGLWRAHTFPDIHIDNSDVTALFVDRDESLWIGTAYDGLFRVRDGAAEHFGNADGLSSDAVGQFFQDAEGSVWAVTASGLDDFRDQPITSYSLRQGLSAAGVGAVVASRNGDVWIANFQAVDRLHNNRLSGIRPGTGLPGQNVTTLFEDHAEHLWLGIDDGLWVYDGSVFHPVRHRDGTPLGVVFAITEDIHNSIWVRAAKNLDRIDNLQLREEITSPQIVTDYTLAANPKGGIVLGLVNGDLLFYRDGATQNFPSHESGNSAQIRDLLVENDGSVWATNVAELVRLKNGKRENLSVRNGLPCDGIFALVKDASDAIWLYTKCGIVEIDKAALDRWWAKPESRVEFKLIDEFDGVQPGLTSLKPQAARTPDGRLWFVNGRILQMFDPIHPHTNSVPPPVHIEEVIADRQIYLPGPNLSLPALTHDIQIDYAGLSFVAPQKVRFRYKLEGRDTDWQEPGTRRQAFYSELPPGQYRFHVMACNNDGLWNGTGAALDFVVPPALYQTGWFKLALLLCALAVVWLLFRLRLRQLTSQIQSRLAERLGERERIARELHDTLLQGFHGLMLRFQVVNQMIPKNEKAHEIMEDTMNRADLLMSESRERIRNLRSQTGAVAALPEALSAVGEERRAGESIGFLLVVEGAPRELNSVIRDEMYLIGREAIVNSLTHSQGSMVEVEINFDQAGIRVRVRDDGKGIPAEILRSGGVAGHWGLSGMQERAHKIGGQFKIWNRSGAGTEVELKVPGGIAYTPENRASPWTKIRAIFGRSKSGSSLGE
jgi:signal transduction histidine kinase/ligand-binding sensor domain-containing protein